MVFESCSPAESDILLLSHRSSPYSVISLLAFVTLWLSSKSVGEANRVVLDMMIWTMLNGCSWQAVEQIIALRYSMLTGVYSLCKKSFIDGNIILRKSNLGADRIWLQRSWRLYTQLQGFWELYVEGRVIIYRTVNSCKYLLRYNPIKLKENPWNTWS